MTPGGIAPAHNGARYPEAMELPPGHQLELCEPYDAACADYRVLELVRDRAESVVSVQLLAHGAWRELGAFSGYDEAVALARDHCVVSGKSVLVHDQNNACSIVFRVSPAEYTAAGPLQRSLL